MSQRECHKSVPPFTLGLTGVYSSPSVDNRLMTIFWPSTVGVTTSAGFESVRDGSGGPESLERDPSQALLSSQSSSQQSRFLQRCLNISARISYDA